MRGARPGGSTNRPGLIAGNNNLLTHSDPGLKRAGAVGAQPPTSRPGTPAGPGGRRNKSVEALAAERKAAQMRSIRKWSIIAGISAFVLPILAFAIGYVIFTPPDPRSLIQKSSKVVEIQYADGSTMGKISGAGAKDIVEKDKIPKHVKDAVLAAEDRDFYKHQGFSPVGILRAMWKQVTGGSGGGSTVTQQYIKNATEDDDQTLWRKYREICMAAKLEQAYSKDDILWAYLNIIYFGRGFGIKSAADGYFNKEPKDLTVAEAAVLGLVIQRPSDWQSEVDEAQAAGRFNYTLDGMVEMGSLSPAERAQIKFPTVATPTEKSSDGFTGSRLFIKKQVLAELAESNIDEAQVIREGFTIQTTIDPKAQKSMEEAARKIIHDERQPKSKAADGHAEPLETAGVAIEPSTGAVLAYYGGEKGNSFDWAEEPQQAGSTFKPFVVAAGLQQGKSIYTRYDASQPAVFGDYSVNNSSSRYPCSQCTVEDSIKYSINTSMVRMAKDVGTAKVAEAARDAGIREKTRQKGSTKSKPLLEPDKGGTYGLGIALGQYRVTAIDMANAYATFANGGMRNDFHFIKSVKEADGDEKQLKQRNSQPAFDKNIKKNKDIARNITKTMEGVAQFSNNATLDGLNGKGARPSAAKTGTHQFGKSTRGGGETEDAWMVGYTPQVSTAVWVGTKDPAALKGTYNRAAGSFSSEGNAHDIFGSKEPTDVWKMFMDNYLDDEKVERFDPMTTVVGSPQRGSDFDDNDTDKRPDRDEDTDASNTPTFPLPPTNLPTFFPDPGDESTEPTKTRPGRPTATFPGFPGFPGN